MIGIIPNYVSDPLQLPDTFQETITWNRYPQVKPPKGNKTYLAQCIYREKEVMFEEVFWINDEWETEGYDYVKLIAWANLPTGMQP